jgi:uncharacterized GH25 family protein
VTLYNGDGFSLQDEAPRPERMLRVRAVSDAGVTALAVSGTRQTGVLVDATAVKERPCWVVVETEPTLIELEGGKFQGYLSHEGLNEVIERRIATGCQGEPGREIYSKYVKVALNSHDGSLRLRTEPVDLPVEIVPLSAEELEVGMRLPLRVLVAGEPGGGLQVRVSHREADAAEPSDDVLYRTDEDGKASIAIDKAGIWRVHTIAMAEAPAEEPADWESLWAGLTFRVSKAERATRG